MTHARLAAVLLAAPLLLAATDPVDDAARCPRVLGRFGDAPDLVAASGEIVELGTSARWTLRFSEPLSVPDEVGKPFRIDIVILDPGVPPVDVGLYRGINRLLRYDAVIDPVTTILLLPEAGQSRFIAPVVDGGTLVMQVPGRTLTDDEDETGTSPGLERLRWGVIVRDEGACDLLGDGRATERLVAQADDPGSSPAPSSSEGDENGSLGTVALALAVALALLGVGGVVLYRSFVQRADG